MPPLSSPGSGPEHDTPLAALAARARATGEEPWLFHRDALDWEWRSWGRVADQVARGAEALRTWSVTPRRVGFDARQHPDAVATGLAIQAAGHLATPVRGGVGGAKAAGCDAWAAVGSGGGAGDVTGVATLELPESTSPLKKVTLRPLELSESPGAIEIPGYGRLSPAALAGSVVALDRRLPAGGRRPIVCAAPDLDEIVRQRLQAWTLIRGAAWVLEPDADCFDETVLWARPTLIWAPAACSLGWLLA